MDNFLSIQHLSIYQFHELLDLSSQVKAQPQRFREKLKEKVLAAKRAGIKTVVLPEKNRKDVLEMKDEATEGLEIKYVSRMDEVLKHTLMTRRVADPKKKFVVKGEAEKSSQTNGASTEVIVASE